MDRMDQRSDSASRGPDPVQAVTFLLALSLGAGAIYAIPALWLAPAGVVVVYTALLWLGRVEDRPLADTLKDSPYYLGFLLTQIALVALFLRFRPAAAADLTQLSLGLGTALSTSIVGLVARQILAMTTPARPVEDEHANGSDRLRSTLDDYQTSQREFVSFLEEFLAHREQLMESERAASAKYVKGVRSTLASLQRVQDRVADHVEKSARQSSEVLDQSHQSMLEAVTGTADALGARARAVRDRLSSLEEEIGRASRGIREAAPGVELEALRAASAETADALRSLGGLGATLGRTAGEASTAATAIRDDLRAIDTILSEFVDIAVKRIDELDRVDGRARVRELERLGGPP